MQPYEMLCALPIIITAVIGLLIMGYVAIKDRGAGRNNFTNWIQKTDSAIIEGGKAFSIWTQEDGRAIVRD